MKNTSGKTPFICEHMHDMSLVSQNNYMKRKITVMHTHEEKELDRLINRLKNNSHSGVEGFDPGNVIIVGAPTNYLYRRPYAAHPMDMDVMNIYPDPRIELTIPNYSKKPDVSQVSKKVLALLARAQ